MGTKYATVAISGYNASPPSDLSTDTATSNKVQWQKHLDKIGGPIKTALESINSALVTFTNFGSRAITTTDSAAATDHMKTIEVASTVTVTFTLSLADAATMAAGYVVHIRNLSAVAITIGRVTGGDTIDGTAANQTLLAGGSVTYKTIAAATGYYTVATTLPAWAARAITTTASTLSGDHARTIEIASTVTVTFTLSLADAATMTSGYTVHVRNLSTVAITIGRVTGGDTIDGTAGNQTLPAGGSVIYKVNASANGYYTVSSTIPSSAGYNTGPIAFPATQVASADANILDDYEEGTFTPGISFGGGTTGITYTTQTGTYTKIGNRVFVDCIITLSSKGSSTGAALITGLPFTVAASTFSVGSMRITALAAAIDAVPVATFTASATTVTLEQLGNAAATVTTLADTNFSNTTQIYIGGQFRV
jgi:hypothetical protein